MRFSEIKKRAAITRFTFIIFAVISVLFTGCGKNSISTGNSRKYREIKMNFQELYFVLHPLRSSRIGIEYTDSSLFTFSEREVYLADNNINKILENLSTLTTEGLTEEEISNSRLILNWLHGEKFAMNNLSYYRNNPVLYCWILNEAIWGTPSRVSSPGENEIKYYKIRLMKIPELINNARRLIDKPSPLHTEASLNMLEGIISKFDSLKSLVSNRYKTDSSMLDSTLKHIEDFQAFIKEDLSDRTYGKIILGSENITRILDCDEHILSDPNILISLAEKRISELLSSKKSLRDKLIQRAAADIQDESDFLFDPSQRSSISKTVMDININIAEPPGFTQSKENIPEIVFTENPLQFNYCRKNIYLSTPFPDKFPVEWIAPTLHSPIPKRGYLLVYPYRFKNDYNSRSYPLTNESLLVYSAIRALSARKSYSSYTLDGDTLRTILCSETYKYGLLFDNIDKLLNRYQKNPLEMRIHDINARVLDLARVVIVIKLHSGNYSIGMASDFLVEKAGLDKGEADYNVKAALISPSIAYAGITRIIMNEMDKKLKSSDDIKLRRLKTLELLQSNPGLPISIIQNSYFK